MTTKVEISKRLILINSASSVVAKVLNVCVLLWLYQHLLRRITPEEYALYPVLMGLMVFAPLMTVILTGLNSEIAIEWRSEQSPELAGPDARFVRAGHRRHGTGRAE